MSVVISKKHLPIINGLVLGVGGYYGIGLTVVCLRVSDDGHYLGEGVANNSLLFVDISKPFQNNCLNVFKIDSRESKFALSRVDLPGQEFFGQVICSMNLYGEE